MSCECGRWDCDECDPGWRRKFRFAVAVERAKLQLEDEQERKELRRQLDAMSPLRREKYDWKW